MKKICMLIVLVLPLFTKGQALFNTNQRLTLQTGIDPALLITFRYERRLENVLLQKDLYPVAEFSSSLSLPGIKKSEFKIGNRLPVWRNQKLGLITGLHASYGQVETLNFDSKKLALDADVAFGFYSNKRFLAFTASYEKILANQLIHSPYYRDRFYPDAADGWYKGSGGTIQLGIEAGLLIKNSIDLYTEIKIPMTEKLRGLMGSPGHVNLGVGYRF
jgi:hypothetical protein